jgi:hypothetical protein
MVAHAALTESVAWIIGFIQFVDQYYHQLLKAKFGPTKAWHVNSSIGHHRYKMTRLEAGVNNEE